MFRPIIPGTDFISANKHPQMMFSFVSYCRVFSCLIDSAVCTKTHGTITIHIFHPSILSEHVSSIFQGNLPRFQLHRSWGFHFFSALIIVHRLPPLVTRPLWTSALHGW